LLASFEAIAISFQESLLPSRIWSVTLLTTHLENRTLRLAEFRLLEQQLTELEVLQNEFSLKKTLGHCFR
jgi:hypothetical protein